MRSSNSTILPEVLHRSNLFNFNIKKRFHRVSNAHFIGLRMDTKNHLIPHLTGKSRLLGDQRSNKHRVDIHRLPEPFTNLLQARSRKKGFTVPKQIIYIEPLAQEDLHSW